LTDATEIVDGIVAAQPRMVTPDIGYRTSDVRYQMTSDV
jgi:hypothetical protein